MINHNGYLMFHPDLRPVLGPYRKRNYHSIDLDMVEIPDNLMQFVHVCLVLIVRIHLDIFFSLAFTTKQNSTSKNLDFPLKNYFLVFF